MDDEKELLKTSKEFQEFLPGIKIISPDGWHKDARFNYEWNEELITLEEYFQRALNSKIQLIDHPNNAPFLYWARNKMINDSLVFSLANSRERP